MSESNGTALASTANSTPAVPNGGRPTGSPGTYIAGLEDTAPMEAVDWPQRSGDQGERLEAAVTRRSRQVKVAKELVGLDSHTELFQYLDEDEVEAEREVARLRREKAREFAAWEAERSLKRRKNDVKRSDRRGAWWRFLDRRAARKDEREVLVDRRWHDRADRVRRRLTSIDAQIATQIRASTRWSTALIALMAVGMAYTGFTVQANFVPDHNLTDPRYWLSLGLEAMASVALMALMRHDARAALADIVRTPTQVKVGWAVKAGLVLVSLAAAAGPSIRQGDLGDIVATGWAPLLVAAVLVIHDHIAQGDAKVLLKLTDKAGQERVKHLAAVVVLAMQNGLMEPSRDNKAGETAPSASRLVAFLKISKPEAMQIRDEVNRQAQLVG